MFIYIIEAVIYFYFSYCIYMIAERMGHSASWQAFVPVWNFFLICDLAGYNWGWACALIPLLGWDLFSSLLLSVITLGDPAATPWYWPLVRIYPLLCLGLLAAMFSSISESCSRPAWLGLLMVVPLVNLGAAGYLAFSSCREYEVIRSAKVGRVIPDKTIAPRPRPKNGAVTLAQRSAGAQRLAEAQREEYLQRVLEARKVRNG
ncbi:MAG: hypothetical protein PHW04_08910 [Candidatus Wallbacteria bacterium]|nr:hypothetical protein [Candidatus Wallbacteria bacterium]